MPEGSQRNVPPAKNRLRQGWQRRCIPIASRVFFLLTNLSRAVAIQRSFAHDIKLCCAQLAAL
jgi:hypothetical protein